MTRTKRIILTALLTVCVMAALCCSVFAGNAQPEISSLYITDDARFSAVSVIAPEDCMLILALYNADGRMLDSATASVSGQVSEQTIGMSFPPQTFSYAQAFLLSAEGFSPLCTSIKTESVPGQYRVQMVDTHGEFLSVYETQVLAYNDTVSCPPFPTKEGYQFNGWYTTSDLTEKYDFSRPVTGNITLYAGWLDIHAPEAQVTDAELEQVLLCSQHILDLTADFTFDGYVPQEDIDSVLDLVEAYAAQLKEQGIITYYNREYNSLYMEFSSLIPYVYSPAITGKDSSGSDADILMLDPFGNETDASSNRGYLASTMGKMIESTLGDALTSSYSDDAVDIDELQSLPDCEYLLWHGHGGYTTSQHSYLITGQALEDTAALRQVYYAFSQKHCYICSSGWKNSNREGDYIAVTASFFQDKVNSGTWSIDGGLVYLAACHSATDTVLVHEFLNLGADVVFGNTGSQGISSVYDQMMMEYIIRYMCAKGPKIENRTILEEVDERYYCASEALNMAHQYMDAWFHMTLGEDVEYPYSSFEFDASGRLIPHNDVTVQYFGAGDFTIVPGILGSVYSSDNSVDLNAVTLELVGVQEIQAPLSREEVFYFDKLVPGTYTLNCYYQDKLLKTDKNIQVTDHRYTNLGEIDLMLSTLNVKVIDEDAVFIPEAVVTVTDKEGDKQTAMLTSLDDGTQAYQLRTVPGDYKITVTCENYGEKTVPVILADKKTVSVTLSAFCTVTFDPNGGECATSTRKIAAGYMVGTLPTATRTDYTFKEWNTSADGAGVTFTEQSFVLKDITVYAIWETPNNVEEDLYHIASVLDESQVVTVMDCSTEENYNIQMWEAADLYDYTFYVTYVGDGYYKITSRYSGLAVTILDSNIVQASYTGADTQLWKFVPSGNNGSYYIVSKYHNLYLSMSNALPASGVNVIAHATGGTTSQQWKLVLWE